MSGDSNSVHFQPLSCHYIGPCFPRVDNNKIMRAANELYAFRMRITLILAQISVNNNYTALKVSEKFQIKPKIFQPFFSHYGFPSAMSYSFCQNFNNSEVINEILKETIQFLGLSWFHREPIQIKCQLLLFRTNSFNRWEMKWLSTVCHIFSCSYHS